MKIRRILALFLPEILCEIARGQQQMSLLEDQPKAKPMGVLLAHRKDEVRPEDRLVAVDARAFCAGVRPGQTPAEANALLAGLQIHVVQYAQVQERLLAIAEVAAQYGTTPSWNAHQDVDTVWLDITGVGHLYGDEEQLGEELAEQVRFLGHRVRLAVASGPRLAQAVARFGHTEVQLVEEGDGGRALSDLPLAALPLDQERIFFLGRLGIFQVGQLADLPPAAASSRLGPQALSILQLVQGIDLSLLSPGEFPRSLQEESLWDEPAEGLSPLLFALHGIISRLSARLRGRGEACSSIECELMHDRAIARHLQVLETTVIEFELASPLYQEGDLERVIRTRFEACELRAPTVGLRVRLRQLSAQSQHQLGLSRKTERSFQSSGPWAQEFPVLVAELQSDLGTDQVGLLQVQASHIPEECSVFQPLSQKSFSRLSTRKRASAINSPAQQLGLCPGLDRLTRILPYPQKINVPLRVGEAFALGTQFYVIERLRFMRRLENAKWWEEASLSRDYHWAWLRNQYGGTEALLFVDRKNGEGFVQALRD